VENKTLLVKRWSPAIFLCAVIFVMSSLPGADFSTNDGQNFAIRKVLHVLEFATLFLTFYRATKKLSISVILTVLFAITDEWHQTYIPGRTGKLQDIFIDSIGAGLGGLVLWKYYQHLPKQLKNWLEE
jgi:VanZ family protein